MVATEEEMRDARLDLQWRDYCAHMLIPLSKCRRANYSLPWRCSDERHAYEKCQYDQYQRRVREMKADIQAAKEAKRAEQGE